jgi:AraC-like DNA-binding protein
MRHARPISNGVVFRASLIGSRELIVELGGDPDAISRAARVPAYAFETPDVYIDAECLIDYLELAAQGCNCPEFGLLHGTRLPMGIFGQIWLLMRDAESVYAALQCFVKYYRLFTDMGTFRFEPAQGGQWLHYSVQPLGRYGESQVVNASLAVVCMFIRDNILARWQPPRVALRQHAVDNGAFEEFFGRSPEFGSTKDALFVENSILDRTLGNGELGSLSRNSVPMYSQLEGPIILTEVKSILTILLPYRECSISTVAEAMRLSERTLQRRLEVLGTNFREVVDTVRAELSWHHVTSSKLRIFQIADMLGYQTQSAFARAFHRWHGLSPRAARAAGGSDKLHLRNG